MNAVNGTAFSARGAWLYPDVRSRTAYHLAFCFPIRCSSWAMLGIGQPLVFVTAFSVLKSTQKRQEPFGFGVSNIWLQAVACEGLIILLAIALSMNCFVACCFDIDCNRADLLFPGVWYQAFSSSKRSILAGCSDNSLAKTVLNLCTRLVVLSLASDNSSGKQICIF